MQIKEGVIWIETIPWGLVWQIHTSYENVRVQVV